MTKVIKRREGPRAAIGPSGCCVFLGVQVICAVVREAAAPKAGPIGHGKMKGGRGCLFRLAIERGTLRVTQGSRVGHGVTGAVVRVASLLSRTVCGGLHGQAVIAGSPSHLKRAVIGPEQISRQMTEGGLPSAQPTVSRDGGHRLLFLGLTTNRARGAVSRWSVLVFTAVKDGISVSNSNWCLVKREAGTHLQEISLTNYYASSTRNWINYYTVQPDALSR